MQIPSSTLSVAPNPLLPTDALLPNDIVMQSKQRAEKELPVQLRSLAERVHLNMEKTYRIYREEETRSFQASEPIINSLIVELDTQDIDFQYLSSKLYHAIPLSNTVSDTRFVKVLDSLDEESDQLTKAIYSKVEELGGSLDEERSQLLGNIERITKTTERHVESISSRINELHNEKYRLYKLSSTQAIDSRIEELDNAIDALTEEQYKAYEDGRKAIEEEENKSHKLSEELRTEQKKLNSFSSYWRQYLSIQREKICNWFQRRATQVSNVFSKMSERLLQLNPSWALNAKTTVGSFATHASDVTGSGAIQPFHYARQGVDLAIANASAAAIPVSIGARVLGTVAEKVGLTSVANYFNNQAKNILRGVAENWSAANEGPLGRAFDAQIHAVTSLLEPLIGHNQQFLADWITGNLPARIVYVPDSIQVRDMAESPNVQWAISEFYAKGAPLDGQTFHYDTFEAFWETIVDPRTAN